MISRTDTKDCVSMSVNLIDPQEKLTIPNKQYIPA